MEMILYGSLMAVTTGVLLLAARLRRYRKQVAHLLSELELLEQTDTRSLLTSACPAGRTDELISAINRVMEQYRLAVGQLSKANSVYRESITGISHDIRTPLTSVKGYVQMASNPKVTEEKRKEYLGIVGERLEDLTQLLDQLFEYARLEAGEMKLEKEKINAGNLFAETVSLFYQDFLEKGCEPEVIIPPKPCYICADRHALARIMENLIKNALVHGTGDYRLVLSQEEGHTAIRISNRTQSIEKQDLDRIFDRFYTTDQSRSRKTTGLGLAVVKELAGLMGGGAAAFLEEGLFTVEVIF